MVLLHFGMPFNWQLGPGLGLADTLETEVEEPVSANDGTAESLSL